MVDIVIPHSRLIETIPTEHKSIDDSIPTADNIIGLTEDDYEKAARIIDPNKKDRGIRHIVSQTSGRNSSLALNKVVKVRNNNYYYLYTKGNGALESYKYDNSPFSSNTPRGEVDNTVAGVFDHEEVLEDCENNLKAESLGVRVRLPARAYKLNRLVVNGEEISADEYVKKFGKGNNESAPYVVEYLSRDPYKLSDVQEMIDSSITNGSISADLKIAIKTSVKNWNNDNLKVYNNLHHKWKDKIDTLSDADILDILVDSLRANVDVMAQNLGNLHGGGYHHGDLHHQNFSFFLSEISDWSAMAEENVNWGREDDLDRYLDELKRTHDRIFKLANKLNIRTELLDQLYSDGYLINHFRSQYEDEKKKKANKTSTLDDILNM